MRGCSVMTKALFLDRDGVINNDVGYASKPADITFMPGIFTLCRHAQQQGYRLIIVTNQSGIARAYYSEGDFQALSDWMREQFSTQGIQLDAIYHCPHHPAITGPCHCRKPEPGMLLQAIEQFGIDPIYSVMIGDNQSDMLAAFRAGIATRLLFNQQPVPEDTPATAVIHSLQQATPYLI